MLGEEWCEGHSPASDAAPRLGEVIGQSPVMQGVVDLVRKVAHSPVSVLLSGETGTGKTLIAQVLHRLSPRRARPCVVQNCGVLPETLCESELFGYKRGAFSGAVQDKKGLFEIAEGGTIFLDEISELNGSMQVKLLQVLQDGSFRRVGDNQMRHIDVRVISASNKNLEAEVARGTFREDLYYRLSVFPITVPPLRERRFDIPLLAMHFLRKHRDRINPGVDEISPAAMEWFCTYDYPGNVRELENLLMRALVLSTPPEILPGAWIPSGRSFTPVPVTRLDDLERDVIVKRIARHDGNLDTVAKELGISRTTLWRRLREYQIVHD